MPPKKKRAMVKNSTTGHGHGWVRHAAAQGAPEEPAPVIEDVPAPSETEAVSTAPPPGSLIEIITEVLQPAAQFYFEAAKSPKKRKRELVTADFTVEQEQEMVDWLKAPEQDCILNKKHRNYIKKGLKDTLWEQKAREMGKASDQLKKWYINMRTRFGKLKQTPSGSSNNELTARDRWILHHFEFLSPHLVVQVKKRVTLSMKTKVQARAASTTTAGAPQSESDAADHQPPTAAQSDIDTCLGCRSGATDDAEATMSNIAELQRQLQNKLSNTETSRFLTNHGSRFKVSPVFDVMPPRKKTAMVKNSTTGHGHGWVRRAAAQGAPEEPAPVIEDVPAPSETDAESTAPPPGSLIEIITEVLQPAAQFFFEAAKSPKKRKRELVTADFTEEQEQEMVDWLKAPEQDCILNKKHRNYIKKGLKDTLWEQKAREMGKASNQLKKWYINMRTRFGKLKQTPSGSSNNELTARDRWILHHFEFLSPHLVVQVKKRVTLQMKTKVQARAALTTTAGAPQSESDAADHQPPTAAQSDTDTSLGCRSGATDDAELKRQLQIKLSNTEKSPLQRQKDTFTDFMKEVTYTFPPPMWLRFQSEVSNLLQRYQFELHQVLPTQTQQQRGEFLMPCAPAPIPGPSSQQCCSVGWKPHPGQVHRPTSVWGSQ
ncbi:uncharacterized protein LOC117501899 [Thalassophryne amazonica]|uniref:uncharacterized protein LOC117501899 n=1 Tax=Thalassophryne amazonica TaxID=390379 RepID=UPI0014723D11|nr:uncharacterized protein LOC117501899 [Thalassophryne amazonica]